MLALMNYIDGQFVPAASGQTLEDINPATSQPIATIPRSEHQDVEQAAQAAKAGQAGRDEPGAQKVE